MAWLEEMSLLEPYDEYVFKNPEDSIIAKGGEIFFGILKGEVVATVALMPTPYGALELNKMAVKKECQGRGIGNGILTFILEHCYFRALPIEGRERSRVVFQFKA